MGVKRKKEDMVVEVLYEPMYPAAEAGRLVGLSSDRVRRWLKGYSYRAGKDTRELPPVIRRQASGTSYASFLDLVDLLFVKEFLKRGFPLQRIRKALDEAREILGKDHFARQSFFTNGKNIYFMVKDEGDAILELLSGGQWAIPEVIKGLGRQIDFDGRSELARRWFPFGPERLIVLDPLVSFGRPSIVGKGVATSNVFDFFLAEKKDKSAVCEWLALTEEEAEEAIRFEKQLAA